MPLARRPPSTRSPRTSSRKTEAGLVVTSLVAALLGLFPRTARAAEGEAGNLTNLRETKPPPVSDDLRLRIGFNFNGGGLIAPTLWAGGGFAFRIGAQLGPRFGVYYQVMPMAVAKVASDDTDTARATLGTVPNSVLVSYTPTDWLELGLGPSVDYAGAAVSVTGANGSASASDWTLRPGIASRVALHIGSRDARTGERTSLAFGADPHLTLFEDSTVALFFTMGFGLDWY
jgi:hypothetical protein